MESQSIIHGRYHLLSEIGQGGLGIIYHAQDTLLKRDVAIKILHPSGLKSDSQARLLREAQAVAQLNHPNIVTVYDAGQVDGSSFIVMELIHGRSLRENPPQVMDAILGITRQICAALEHAHQHGIIHRDLKPENVIITPDGTAKLMDFGLAYSVATRLTVEQGIIGTVFYIAPEQALGGEIDGRADLYALGIMLYELTTGRLPFTADDLMAVISQHLYAPVVPPRIHNENISASLETLIMKLLSKQPADRPASASEVLIALKTLESPEAQTIPARELSLIDRIVRGRLVGREQELGEMNAYWQRVICGEGQMLLISGEPGIGKTRLVREFATRVEILGGKVLAGECYAEGSVPYAPVARAIRACLSNGAGIELPDSVLATLLTLVPDLHSHYPKISPNPPLDPGAEQQRLFDSVATLCATLADQTPLIFFIDDVHWADSGTLTMLRHMTRNLRHKRVMLVATYREVELDEARPFHEILLDLNRERLTVRLKLERLSQDETRSLLAILFDEEVTPDFLDGIYRETEGNPFFIEEVCKELVESGKLYFADGRWHRPSMDKLEIPQSIRVAIQSRLAKLPEPVHNMLRMAAIQGREFEYEALKLAGEMDEDTLIEALERAEHAQLIGEARSPMGIKFIFAHALIPSVITDNLSGLRRQRLHRKAGLVLESLHSKDLDEYAPRLARHFIEAGDGDKAIEYLLKSGDKARNLHAYQEAIHYYEQALSYQKDQNLFAQAARTSMKLGLLYHTVFDFPRSQQAYQEGFTLWQRASLSDENISPPPAPHPLRLVWTNFRTLDPCLTGDAHSQAVIDQLFAGLVTINPEMDIEPEIARSWEILDGGRKYIFLLRENTLWSDGKPITAHDFEYAFKRTLRPDLASPAASMLYDLKGARAFNQEETDDPDRIGVKAVDDHTLLVELEAPAGYFLYLMGGAPAYPLPRHVVERVGPDWTQPGNIVSNGPFLLETWNPGESILLKRNPRYCGNFSGNLQQVQIKFSEGLDTNYVVKLYEQNEVDSSPIPHTYGQADRLRFRLSGEYITAPLSQTSYVGFDIYQAPFNDRRVRQAFTHAIDRYTLANVIKQGAWSPATGGFIPPGFPGHSPDIGLHYDPESARRLLSEAGYPGGQGFPVIQLLSVVGNEDDVDYLHNQWGTILGIDLKVQMVDWVSFNKVFEDTRPLIYRLAWLADYPDPDNFLRVCLSEQYPQSWNSEYDRLVNQARQVTDHSQRIQLYQTADRILIQEAILIPLIHGRMEFMLKPWVKKYPLSPIKVWFLKDTVIEPH